VGSAVNGWGSNLAGAIVVLFATALGLSGIYRALG
jgi:hypothetical protein